MSYYGEPIDILHIAYRRNGFCVFETSPDKLCGEKETQRFIGTNMDGNPYCKKHMKIVKRSISQ